MARQLKIFYSWQSDLPGKDTRNLISAAIDAAVKCLANTITVIPDRDTKDETGSPNIEQTIFNKINDCDLFVCDLSIVASYVDKDGEKKYTPNPNVLVELGYAVNLLSWGNVICFMNTDYGKVKDLPFDLNHHRVTGYSLQDREKADVRKELRDIISSTVMTIMENGIRPKAGFASHIVGSYDFEMKKVTENIVPFDIQNSEYVHEYKNELLQRAKSKLDEASAIEIAYIEETDVENLQNDKQAEICKKIMGLPAYNLFKNSNSFGSNYQKQKIGEKDQIELKKYVKYYFDIELDNDFFYLGNLEIQTIAPAWQGGLQLRGSDEAKKKYSLIHDCINCFSELTIFEKYLKTFDGLLFFPLAIWNNTTTMDSNISISIVVDESVAEVVIPNNKLIAKDVLKKAGYVYKQDFLKGILKMQDTSDIVDGSPFQPPISAELRKQVSNNMPTLFGSSNEPQYDIDDYVDEIQKYIANPIESSRNEFDFYIRDIRPNEKKWLGKGILVKPKGNVITMSYKITSDKSDGNVEGNIEYQIK